MNLDLFENLAPPASSQSLGAEASVLRGFALPFVSELLPALAAIEAAAPARQMLTPGGLKMSAAMTNCGPLGWVTDRQGYRYTRADPITGRPWPAMPAVLRRLAQEAAQRAGFDDFEPDACLVNRYLPGARLTLHQDRNEVDHAAPIVSVSLGIPAVFLFGGARRGDPVQRTPLHHGDAVVWGGVDRLRYHGVAPIKEAHHPLLGRLRINLTLRKAG